MASVLSALTSSFKTPAKFSKKRSNMDTCFFFEIFSAMRSIIEKGIFSIQNDYAVNTTFCKRNCKPSNIATSRNLYIIVLPEFAEHLRSYRFQSPGPIINCRIEITADKPSIHCPPHYLAFTPKFTYGIVRILYGILPGRRFVDKTISPLLQLPHGTQLTKPPDALLIDRFTMFAVPSHLPSSSVPG